MATPEKLSSQFETPPRKKQISFKSFLDEANNQEHPSSDKTTLDTRPSLFKKLSLASSANKTNSQIERDINGVPQSKSPGPGVSKHPSFFQRKLSLRKDSMKQPGHSEIVNSLFDELDTDSDGMISR